MADQHPLQTILDELYPATSPYFYTKLNGALAIELPKQEQNAIWLLTTEIMLSIRFSDLERNEKKQIVAALNCAKTYHFAEKNTVTVVFPTVGFNSFLPDTPQTAWPV